MKRFKGNIFAGLISLFLLPISANFVYAQSTTFPFNEFTDSLSYNNASARSTGLGDADIADLGHFTSYNLNPALLSFAHNPVSIHLSAYQDWRNNFSHFDLTLPAFNITNEIRSVIRFSYAYADSYMSSVNPLGRDNEPEPELNRYQLESGTSFKISSVFSTGFLQTLSFSNNANAQYWTYAAKAGLFYDPVGSLSYAAVVSGVGRGTEYRFIEDGTTVLGSYDIPVSFEIGATFTFPEDSKDPNFSLSLSNQKRFGQEGVWYKGGMEIKVIKFLSLRSGIQFQPDLNYYMPRFGIGYKSNNISLDYGIAPGTQSKIDGRYHIVGLTINL